MPVATAKSLTFRRDHQTGLYYVSVDGVELEGGYTTLMDVNNKMAQIKEQN